MTAYVLLFKNVKNSTASSKSHTHTHTHTQNTKDLQGGRGSIYISLYVPGTVLQWIILYSDLIYSWVTVRKEMLLYKLKYIVFVFTGLLDHESMFNYICNSHKFNTYYFPSLKCRKYFTVLFKSALFLCTQNSILIKTLNPTINICI